MPRIYQLRANMADGENVPDTKILKGAKLVVNVDEALPDILVVTYEHGNRLFQGVLLDSTKRNLPYGVSSLHPVYTGTEDRLYSATQRFAYQEPGKEPRKPSVRPMARYKNSKMTVRLRPRQVLCSKCRGICNENSENVDNSRKRKADPNEIIESRESPTVTDSGDRQIAPPTATGGRVLRKKRSVVGSMEDLWEENVFEESKLSTIANTRTIKISFGREGEGTVLKIPAVNPTRDAGSKAARRALKKAKKEARRKILLGSGGSPCYNPEALVSRRHKHKVKHKRRHREFKESPIRSSVDVVPASIVEIDQKPSIVSATDVEEIKERCLNQKLSISLRRLNASAYQSCSATSSGQEDGGSDGESAGVPDFPATQQREENAQGESAASLSVGDVVWGKVHGFPWWPGKVINIPGHGQAHVTWYGSPTSSLMPCDQLSPFLENFKLRYNKKKRGPYKEAIKQAICEARAKHTAPLIPPVPTPHRSPSAPQEVVSTLVRPALASPREIDVVS